MQHERLTYPPRMTESVATFLRTEDGNLQICALQPNLRSRKGRFYEVFDCMVRPSRYGSATDDIPWIADNLGDCRRCPPDTPLSTLAEIAGDVLVFINRPLENVNHFFFNELVNKAMREDCGLVTGIAVDLSGRIVHSGLTISPDGRPADSFAGRAFADFTAMEESDVVRSVDLISDEFFAIRREHLAAVGGLSTVSSFRMPQLVRRLLLNASFRGLRVLVTPFAVATVEVARKREFDPTQPIHESEAAANPTTVCPSSVTGSAQVNARYPTWKYVIPFPTDTMMGNVGAPSIENFLVIADAWGRIGSRHMPEGATVLDIGCGCGRIARVLANDGRIRKYIGFDVMRAQIEWCQNFIQPAWPQVAEFHWFDLHSERYNPTGALRAEDLSFPAADATVDVIFAASVFTHLLEADALHYLREIRRVLTPAGVALLSIHESVAPGQRFSGTEARIDIDPAYFVELARHAGLRERDNSNDFCGQRLFSLQRTE